MEAIIEHPPNTPISAISPHNPRYLQQLSVAKRRENRIAAELHEREVELLAVAKLVSLQPVVQNPYQKTVAEQIDMLDAEIAQADVDALPKLVDAKCKLWALLFPKPRGRGQRSMSHVETVQVVSDSGTVGQ